MTSAAYQLPIDEQALLAILRRYGAAKASVFGSFARGDYTAASDLDLLVEFSQPTSLFAQIDLQLELEKAAKRPVEVVTDIHPAFKAYITPELAPLPL